MRLHGCALIALLGAGSACATTGADRDRFITAPSNGLDRAAQCGEPETTSWLLSERQRVHDASCGSHRGSLSPHIHHDPVRLTHELRQRQPSLADEREAP